MRIRSTKPEFWRSERIASVDWSARLVLKGLESYVDDNGVGKDDLALIVADVFPRDLSRNPPGTLQKVSEAIGSLHRAGLLWRYEVDGTKLLYVAFWESVQRIDKPSAGRFRRPDGTKDYRESEIRESFPEPSRNTPGTLPPGTGEQGNRGTGEQTEIPSSAAPKDHPPKDPDGFTEFWAVYPRKVGRQAAVNAWAKARRRGVLPSVMNDGAKRLANDPNLPADRNYIPHPATWLNEGRWDDEPYSPSGQPPARGRVAPKVYGGGDGKPKGIY